MFSLVTLRTVVVLSYDSIVMIIKFLVIIYFPNVPFIKKVPLGLSVICFHHFLMSFFISSMLYHCV